MNLYAFIGSHFSNKTVLYHTLWKYPEYTNWEIEKSRIHYHTAKHGKTYVDGHFGNVTVWVEQYEQLHEQGIQSTQNYCDAIEWGVNNRKSKPASITYIQINMVIDGPNVNESYMMPLKMSPLSSTALIISQIKSFNHYLYDKHKQDQTIDTVREIDDATQITLPSLRSNKTKNIGKILIEAKYVLSDEKSIIRYHGKKTIKATKLKIAKPIDPIKPNFKELNRRHKTRDKLYKEQELLQGKFIPVDNDDGDIDINDINVNDINSDDETANDTQPIVIATPKQKSKRRGKRAK